MSYRYDELYVSHTFTANLLFGNLYAASVANDAFVPDAFVFTAMTFVIFYRTENTFAEQSVSLRLICTVVDGFRFQDFPA